MVVNIAGDKAADDIEPAGVTEYLATGSLQHVNSRILPHLLPAAPSTTTALELSAHGPNPAVNAAAAAGATPAAAPAVFTQELHDNMNMFLKTATAYLVMLIDDHNKGSGV